MPSVKADSNSMFQTLLVIILVIAVAYLIYYLYTSKAVQNSGDVKNDNSDMEEMKKKMDMMKQKMQNAVQTGKDNLMNNNSQVNASMHGSPNGMQNPIANKMNTTQSSDGSIIGQNNNEFFNADPNYSNERNTMQFPKETLSAEELLPQDNSSVWAQVNPSGQGSLKDRNFLQSGYHIGINTVGQTLRNANRQLRSEPPCPQVKVSPWMQSTIEPDVGRKPFEIGGC